MPKTILITGATGGIGQKTAEYLLNLGHQVILHGRTPEKCAEIAPDHLGVRARISADFAVLSEVHAMADQIARTEPDLDILINNAGVLQSDSMPTQDGLDLRFSVNTVAPYLLTTLLLDNFSLDGRVVSVVSAAQAPVEVEAIYRRSQYKDIEAYAQSKLALMIWNMELSKIYPKGPAFLSVNPGSLLGSKMVRNAFGFRGRPLDIGAKILCEASLDERFAKKSGTYFDNDKAVFTEPNEAAREPDQISLVMDMLQDQKSHFFAKFLG